MLLGVLGNISTGYALSNPGGIDAPPDTVIGGPQTQPPYHHFNPLTISSGGPPGSPAPNYAVSPSGAAGQLQFQAANNASPDSGICPAGTIPSSQGCLSACPTGTIVDPAGSNTCVSPALATGGPSGGSTATSVTTSSTTGSSNHGGPSGIMQSASIPPCSAMPVPAPMGSSCGNPDGSVATIAADGISQVTTSPTGVQTIYTPPTTGITLFGYNFSPTMIAVGLGGLAIAGLALHARKKRKAA